VTIWLNGEKREVASAATIGELVEEMQLPARALLVEHNGLALRREEWTGARIADGDRVEALRIVAGG
jgi:sulfur carrier protein